jgi:CO/xanthine dehydrogenase FAD-binding subunit
MRSALSGLELLRPRKLDEALGLLARSDRPLPIAGGTDLYVYLNAGTLEARRFMDVTRLAELKRLSATPKAVTIGGGVTFRTLREHPAIRKRFPSLAAAAAEVGAWQIQNRATIAGNIANASPAGDSLPVLLAHDAVVHARSARGAREIPFESLYRGYRDLALEKNELITAVTLATPPRGSVAFFRKVGTRRAQSISKVVFAGMIACDVRGHVTRARLAYGSMAPVPKRARNAEAALEGRGLTTTAMAEARAELSRDLAPIDDIRSDREYRMTVAGNVLEQFLRPLITRG